MRRCGPLPLHWVALLLLAPLTLVTTRGLPNDHNGSATETWSEGQENRVKRAASPTTESTSGRTSSEDTVEDSSPSDLENPQMAIHHPAMHGDQYMHSHDNNSAEGEKHEIHAGVHVAEWRWEYVKTPFIYASFVIIAGLCKIAYHHADFLSSIIPESCLLIALGTVVGSILFVTDSENILPRFDSRTFFLFLLPPIVLESAYSLHDRAFFGNLGTILLYAVVGTLMNCFMIGPTLYGLSEVGALGTLNLGIMECLVFSALISAVDPVAVLAIFQEVGVHKVLYFLVFGESLLNDAVTVVLYTMMVALSNSPVVSAGQLGLGVAAFFTVSLGGLSIGIFMGILTALITKNTSGVRVVEPLAMLGIAYLSYLTAEMVHFSGIISIIGCGLVQAEYAWANISKKSSTTVKYFSKMLSAVCDTVIFLFLGMVLVNDSHVWNTPFVFWATILCLIYRFAVVLLLTYLANRLDRVRRINLEEQFIMGYGGLRGAVAFSLVIMLEDSVVKNKDMFVTSTLFIILFTVFIQDLKIYNFAIGPFVIQWLFSLITIFVGGSIKPLVNLLKIRLATKNQSLFTEINIMVVDSVMAGIEEITGHHGDNYWKQTFYSYNEKYFKAWLQRDVHDNPLTRVYTKLVLADHFAHLYGPATMIEDRQPLTGGLMEVPEESCIEEVETVAGAGAHMPERPPTEKSVKRVRFGETGPRKFSVSARGSPSPEPTPTRRHTVISPAAFRRRRRSTATASSTPGTTGGPAEEEDTSKLLQKAFQNNPYYRFHRKYNPNLVEDDQQDLATHLRARRMRARRLTLAATHSIHSSQGSDEELRKENTPASDRPVTAPAPLSSSIGYKSASPINDQTINFLLERAHRRRSVMSGKFPRMERSNTVGSSVSTDSRNKVRPMNGPTSAVSNLTADDSLLRCQDNDDLDGSVDSLGSVEDLISPRDDDGRKTTSSGKHGSSRMKKSLTFDVSSSSDEQPKKDETKF